MQAPTGDSMRISDDVISTLRVDSAVRVTYVCFFWTAAVSRTLEGRRDYNRTDRERVALKVSVVLEGLIDALLLTTHINNFTYCNLGVRQNFIYFFSGDIIEMNTSNNTDRPSNRFT